MPGRDLRRQRALRASGERPPGGQPDDDTLSGGGLECAGDRASGVVIAPLVGRTEVGEHVGDAHHRFALSTAHATHRRAFLRPCRGHRASVCVWPHESVMRARRYARITLSCGHTQTLARWPRHGRRNARRCVACAVERAKR